MYTIRSSHDHYRLRPLKVTHDSLTAVCTVVRFKLMAKLLDYCHSEITMFRVSAVKFSWLNLESVRSQANVA